MNWCCTLCRRNQNERDREYLRQTTKLTSYELAELSLPVFIGAGLATSTHAIVNIIVGENLILELILVAFYTLSWYLIGKIVMYYLHIDQTKKYTHKFFELIRKYKMSSLIKDSVTETSGFTWKEFFIVYSFRLMYDKFGIGAAFSGFFFILILAFTLITLSDRVQRIFLGFSPEINKMLVHYDAISFGVPLAFVTTVLFALSAEDGGFSYTHKDSFLFTWDGTFSYKSSENRQSAPYILYTFIATLIVTTVQYTEFEIRSTTKRRSQLRMSVASLHKAMQDLVREEEKNKETNETKNTNSEEIGRSSILGQETSLSFALNPRYYFPPSISAKEGIIAFWNKFWGNFAGLAWFVLIIDNISIPLDDEGAAYIQQYLTLLLIALILTWQGPEILANIKIIQEKQAKKFSRSSIYRESENRNSKTHRPKSSGVVAGEEENKENSNKEMKTDAYCCGKQGFKYTEVYKRYRRLKFFVQKSNIKQNGVVMTCIRFIIGLSWEVLITETFAILRITDSSAIVAGFVTFLSIIFMLFFAITIHLYIRNWDGQDIDEQQDTPTDLESNESELKNMSSIINPVHFTIDTSKKGKGESKFDEIKENEVELDDQLDYNDNNKKTTEV